MNSVITFPEELTKPFETPWRQASVVHIVDGDTFDLMVDLGFDVHIHARIRLLHGDTFNREDKLNVGIDTPEIRGEEKVLGFKAKDRVEELIGGKEVRIFSRRGGSRGKYGRWLAAVVFRMEDRWVDLGSFLVEEGHAEVKMY